MYFMRFPMYFLRALMYSKKVFHDRDEGSNGVLRMKIFLTSVKICQIREISLERIKIYRSNTNAAEIRKSLVYKTTSVNNQVSDND